MKATKQTRFANRFTNRFTNRFARGRAEMAQYGLPLRLVMCGRVVNGRFYLTNRTK